MTSSEIAAVSKITKKHTVVLSDLEMRTHPHSSATEAAAFRAFCLMSAAAEGAAPEDQRGSGLHPESVRSLPAADVEEQ